MAGARGVKNSHPRGLSRFARQALLATAIFAAPVFGGTAIEWRGAGWYLWMSGPDEEGRAFRSPVTGAFADQNACLKSREEWIAMDARSDPEYQNRYEYTCHYYAEPWPA